MLLRGFRGTGTACSRAAASVVHLPPLPPSPPPPSPPSPPRPRRPLLDSTSTRALRVSSEAVPHVKSLHELPGPRGLPVLGTLLEHAGSAERTHELWAERCRTYGPIFRERVGPTDLVCICHPEGVEQLLRHSTRHPQRLKFAPIEAIRDESGMPYGLLLANGESWERLRRPLNNAMLKPRAVDCYDSVFNDISREFVDRMEANKTSDGEISNLEGDALKWSLEGVYQVLYGKRLGCLGDGSEDPSLQVYVENASEEIRLISELFFVPPWLCKLLLPHKWKALRNNFVTGLRIALDHVQRRVKELEEKGGDSHCPSVMEHFIREGSFTEEEILVNISELMSAAVGTTTNTALVLLHQLAANPHVQETLREEVDAMLGSAPPSASLLKDMPYLNAVLKEIMRYCPVAVALSRITNEDMVILGCRIPAESKCVVPVYAMSRDPELFPQPDTFRPERWLRAGGDSIHPFAVLPFGFGPRMCIGRRVAELEMRMLMVNVLRRFQLELVETKPMRFRYKLILEPTDPVRIRLRPRPRTNQAERRQAV